MTEKGSPAFFRGFVTKIMSNIETESLAILTSGWVDDWKIAVWAALLAVLVILIVLRVLHKIGLRVLVIAVIAAVLLSSGVLCIRQWTSNTPKEPDSILGDPVVGHVKVTVRCDALAGQEDYPADGVMLREISVVFLADETVQDVTLRALHNAGMRYSLDTSTASHTFTTVEGITNGEHGDNVRWIVELNGSSENVELSTLVHDGDTLSLCFAQVSD